VAKDGPILFALTEVPKSGKNPLATALLLVRVTDYSAFRDGILSGPERAALKKNPAGYESAVLEGQATYLLERDGFAALTGSETVAMGLTRKQPGLDATLGQEQAQRVLAPDVAFYVDMAAINQTYGPQIKATQALAKIFIDQGAQIDNNMDKASIEMVKTWFDTLMQVVLDSRNIILSLDIPPEGVQVHGEVKIRGDSPSGKILAAAKPSAFPGLEALPAQAVNYVALDMTPTLFKTVEAMLGFSANPDSPEGRVVKQQQAQLLAAEPRTLYMCSKMSPRMSLSVWNFGDPAKALAARLKLFQSMKAGAKYSMVPIKDKPQVEADAVKYRGASLHHARVHLDLENLAINGPGNKEELLKLLKELTGEFHDCWFGVIDQVLIQVTAPDWMMASTMLDTYYSKTNTIGSGSSKEMLAVRARLPRETNLLGFTDVDLAMRGSGHLIGQMINAQFGRTIKPPARKETQGPPGCIGTAVTLRPEHGSLDLWLPGILIPQIRQFVNPDAP
jgi:hypothetical protein